MRGGRLRAVTQALLWVIVGVLLVLIWLLSPYVLGGLFGDEAGVLSRRGDIGDSFGAVSALFSALTLFGLILTLAIQRRELSAQREALQQQQAALEQQAAELLASRKELTKTSEAAIRSAHIELLRLSIDHPHLASVWPAGLDREPEESQRRLFANLIVSNQQTLYELGLMTDERLRAVFLHLFKSPVIRDLWADSRALRRSTAAGRPTIANFVEHVDLAFEQATAGTHAPPQPNPDAPPPAEPPPSPDPAPAQEVGPAPEAMHDRGVEPPPGPKPEERREPAPSPRPGTEAGPSVA